MVDLRAVYLASIAVLLSSAGCGRVGFDPLQEGLERGTDAGRDAPRLPMIVVPPDRGCDTRQPFSAPVLIDSINSTVRDGDPSISGDELEMYFSSQRSGSFGNRDIWRSTRASIADPWGPPVIDETLSTSSDERAPHLGSDALRMYFSSDRPGGLGAADIWLVTREHRDAPWGDPIHVPELNSAAADESPSLSEDERIVVFHSRRGPSIPDLYIATRPDGDAVWSTPQPITELNGSDTDSEPYLSADGLTILFKTIRLTTASGDLFIATRASVADGFSAPVALAGVNSVGDDGDPVLSRDGCALTFTSTISGDWEIYQATR